MPGGDETGGAATLGGFGDLIGPDPQVDRVYVGVEGPRQEHRGRAPAKAEVHDDGTLREHADTDGGAA